jgi:hypothetical protein
MQEGTMTAHRKAVARKPAPAPESEPDRSGWPGVVRYAIDSTSRTVRLCVIVVVVGAVLLMAVRLGLHFWL